MLILMKVFWVILIVSRDNSIANHGVQGDGSPLLGDFPSINQCINLCLIKSQIIEKEEGLETRVQVYSGCSSRSCDSQSLRIVQFRYTSESCVCYPQGLGAPLAELPKVLKPKEERIRQFFMTDLQVHHGLPLCDFTATCTQCSPSLKASLDRAAASEC